MSVVTGVVLMCALAEDLMTAEKPPGNLAKIDRWLVSRNLQALAEVADKHASGDKHPQFYLYAAGYNHFPKEEFVNFFQTLEWECPENVVLCLQSEEGATLVFRPTFA